MGVKLNDKVAIVTGAGGGVGRAYAHALASAGAKVVVNDLGKSVDGSGVSQPLADVVAAEINTAGGVAVANHNSVADFTEAGRIVETALDAFGAVDILVANAGNMRPVFLHEATEEDWSSVMATHANGTFNCYRHAVPHMMRKNSGSIITTGATMHQGYFPGLGAYRAAKHAILTLTLHAAEELRYYNINVNSITPGVIATRMQKTFVASVAERGLDTSQWSSVGPDKVPPFGLFLCSDAGRSITGRSFFLLPPNIVKAVSSYGQMEELHARGEEWADGEMEERVRSWLASFNDEESYVRAHLRTPEPLQ